MVVMHTPKKKTASLQKLKTDSSRIVCLRMTLYGQSVTVKQLNYGLAPSRIHCSTMLTDDDGNGPPVGIEPPAL
jgi:hypothetical protein